MMNESTAISVCGLTVKYKELTAVKNISFTVEKGEIFGIIGPNGAGKTSTIECLEGLKKQAAGDITIAGIDPAQRRKLYEKIGVQLQEASFPDDIKVDELCRMFSSFYRSPADYHALLEQFELSDKKKAYLKKLSGGQKQKVSIVVALIANPQIVFLDELTTGLDPQARISMWELIKHLREEGKTICMTTHFMDEAEYLCDRICLLAKGEIAAMGTVKELVEQAQLHDKVSFSSGNANSGELEQISGVASVSKEGNVFTLYGTGADFQRDVVSYLIKHSIEFNELASEKPGLEDVFLKLTGYRLEEKA